MLGSLILYLKGMRIMMFQLSGFYYRSVLGGVQEHRRNFHGLRSGTEDFLAAQRRQESRV